MKVNTVRTMYMPEQGMCERHCSCHSDGTQSVVINNYVMGPHSHVPEGYNQVTMCMGCLGEDYMKGLVVIKGVQN